MQPFGRGVRTGLTGRILPWLLALAILAPFAAAQNTTTPDPSTHSLDVARLLLTLALVIGLGFAGFLLFDRFRIADTILLLAFGIALNAAGFLDADTFRSFQPLVAAFAVLIIMFDSGLDLRSGDLAANRMGWAATFSTLGFILTVGLIAVLVHFVLGISWLLAVILGCAVADTAGLVILPIVSQLGVPGKVKTALLVETSLPDAYAITVVLILMNIAVPQETVTDFGSATGNLVGAVSVTLLLGLIMGALWIRALGWLSTRRYAYMTTLAVVLALNWAVNAVGGSGPVAVLLFGLVIGNRALLGEWSEVGRQKVFKDMIQFNGEVVFLVRSFFFVYLGLILDLDGITRNFLLAAVMIVAAIIIARATAVYLMTTGPGVMRNHRGLLIAAIPRGTTAAVVSTLPATRGITGTEAFASYAVIVILLTNLIFTVGLYMFFRSGTKPRSSESAT